MPRNVLIKIRRGTEAQLPVLDVGELGFCTDTNKLYIGTPTGNQLLVAAQSVGDMLKSIYDTDYDGKVDAAETADSVPWAGVTGKPATFPPAGHASTQHASGGSDPVTPAMIGAVNKAGDTMTGTLISDIDIGPNDSRIYTNVCSYKNSNSTVTGTMKITLPNSWSYTMLRIHVVGYDYSSNAAWELVVSGYTYANTPAWYNYSAEVRGNAPFSQVRLGYDGSKCCILLGATTSTWSYPHIAITQVLASHQSYTGWESGWSIQAITDETGITNIVTPSLRKTWHSQNDGTGSGLDADFLDGKHATDFMPKGPLTWNQLKGV